MRGTNWGYSSQRATTYQARAILESKGNTRHTVELGNMSYSSLVLQHTKLRSTSPLSVSISKLNSTSRLKNNSRIIFRDIATPLTSCIISKRWGKNSITCSYYCKGAVNFNQLNSAWLADIYNNDLFVRFQTCRLKPQLTLTQAPSFTHFHVLNWWSAPLMTKHTLSRV